MSEGWEVVIGLEVHAQVNSKSKLFSRSSTEFGVEPNSNVSFFDMAAPGKLPYINKTCVEYAVKTGLGLNAKINLRSAFDRKHYFYPDLPHGYQISQFYHPIVGPGMLDVSTEEGGTKTVRISRIHLEMDAGKSMHDQHPTESFIDFNRAGTALMEIVTEPDIRSAAEAAEFVKKLRAILRYLGTCDGDMEKGSMRCDANVSVRRSGVKELGTRVEIKNLNSMKNLVKAIDYEVVRQIDSINSNQLVLQETRLFDVQSGVTRSLRSKEDARDYRYFPDPDLLPLEITQEFVEEIRAKLPELPDQKKSRYISQLGLSDYDASVIVSDKDSADYFEETVSYECDAKLAANWILGELFGKLNKVGLDIKETKIKPAQLASLIKSIENGKISGKMAKVVFEAMFEYGDDPDQIIKSKGLVQLDDADAIMKMIDEVLSENEAEVQGYLSGKTKLIGFFVGCIMKKSNGKANPNIVNKLLIERLSGKK